MMQFKYIQLIAVSLFFGVYTFASQAATLVDEEFDDGSYADTGWTAWIQNGNCNTGSYMAVNSNAAYKGAYGLDIYYHMSDSPRGDCQLHQDNNTSLVHKFSPALNHYFVRGYFQFKANSICTSPTVQRKLMYFKPQNWGQTDRWQWFLVAWPWPNCATDGYNISVAYSDYAMGKTLWGNSAANGWDTANNHIYPNRWYYIEVEVEYRTYGTDVLRVWLGQAGTTPKLILERSDLNIRSSSDVASNIGLETVEVGRQVDIARSDFSQGIDEHRYWDNVAVGTTRIGPISGIAPLPPISLR